MLRIGPILMKIGFPSRKNVSDGPAVDDYDAD